LYECLPVLEKILSHFEGLQRQAADGDFNDDQRIQSSITLAWNKTNDYYKKTDASIAWVAALVLHPRYKFQYFENHWKGPAARFVVTAKAQVRALWTTRYKDENIVRDVSPPPALERDYLASILDEMAPLQASQAVLPTHSHDELWQYLAEPCIDHIPLMEYWRQREVQWPHLAAMAFDFLSIPAMSSECKRVFSSVAKLTTPESSRLSSQLLWHQEVLRNWHFRGLIDLSVYNHGIVLD